MVENRSSEERTFVGKCSFCPLKGKGDKGVVEVSGFKSGGPQGLMRELVRRSYECGIGVKDCVIPKIYARSSGSTRKYTGY